MGNSGILHEFQFHFMRTKQTLELIPIPFPANQTAYGIGFLFVTDSFSISNILRTKRHLVFETVVTPEIKNHRCTELELGSHRSEFKASVSVQSCTCCIRLQCRINALVVRNDGTVEAKQPPSNTNVNGRVSSSKPYAHFVVNSSYYHN
ncbi:hypothetical protein LXL04_007084 [Taraxacum kok-saghyz]